MLLEYSKKGANDDRDTRLHNIICCVFYSIIFYNKSIDGEMTVSLGSAIAIIYFSTLAWSWLVFRFAKEGSKEEEGAGAVIVLLVYPIVLPFYLIGKFFNKRK